MNRLRDLRVEQQLTLRELADRSGVSKDSISEIERGVRRPQPITLGKLAHGLGVRPMELLEGRDRKEQEMTKVVVEVSPESDEGFSELIRFTGEKIDEDWDESTQCYFTLYGLPDGGYRVYVDDGSTPAQTLYPQDYSRRYTAEEVIETWPDFTEALGIPRIRDID